MEELHIGQIGWGTVGSAFGRLVADGPLPARLTALAVRDSGARRQAPLPHGVPVLAADELVAAPDVDVVVELAGGTDAPLRWARDALAAGRPYVTANKALLATCGADLALLARDSGAALLASASVGGGTPMIETLQHLSAARGIRRLRGVLNATTTYILARMEDGAGFDAAVGEAQAAGYAEADPSFDLDGRDASQKLAILASVAWGRWRAEAEVDRTGIRDVGVHAGGRVVRLVAEATSDRLRVAPIALETGSPLAAVRGIESVLEIELDDGATFRISGPGAGGAVTARAVYADLARLASGERPVLFA